MSELFFPLSHPYVEKPVAPTDEELKQLLFDDHRSAIEFACDSEEEAQVMVGSHVKFARAILAKWGNQ